MTSNPHVQRKAQEELDLVVGLDRLPIHEDRESLPYIEAVYREVMRWRPVAPLGVPHACNEDDIFEGYFIPKGMPNLSPSPRIAQAKEKRIGATVVANIW